MTNTKQVRLAVYKFYLVETGEKHLFEKDSTGAMAHAKLDEILRGRLSIVHQRRGDTLPEPMPQPNSQWHGGVAVMKLQKYRDRKEYGKDYDESQRRDYPWCWVVVDNRPGVGQITVQHKSDFGNADAAVGIVVESFAHMLAPYGLKMEVKAKVHAGEFWETIERLHDAGDYVKKIVFDFVDPQHVRELDTKDIPEEDARFLMRYLQMSRMEKGIKSAFFCQAVNNHQVDLRRERVSKDMAHLITLFCNNGYNLQVVFAEHGKYQLGQMMRAWRNVPEAKLEEFLTGQQSFNDITGEPEFRLVPWLDEVRESTREYSHEELAASKSKRRHTKSEA